MKKRFLTLMIFILLSIVYASNLEVTVINVGQGDSILIKAPNGLKILIDAGCASDADQLSRSNAMDNIRNALSSNGISSSSPLDYIIVTHYHGDHYDYIDEVVAEFGLPKIAVLDRGGNQKWSGGKLANIPAVYINAIQARRNPKGVLSPGAKIDLGQGAYLLLLCIGYPDHVSAPDKRVKVLGHPDVQADGDENVKSIVFVLRWNGFDMLLGGDCEEKVEEALAPVLLAKGIHVDVYKVHHHGSETSSSAEFLKAVMPEISICSTGHAASYQHPRKQSYDRIYQYTRSFIFQTNLGYSGPLSYCEPPAEYGLLARGNVTICYGGGPSYIVKTRDGEYFYKTDGN